MDPEEMLWTRRGWWDLKGMVGTWRHAGELGQWWGPGGDAGGIGWV